MAKSTADRYRTARALCEDLERFLMHRPIRARRPGPLKRAGHWLHRNRPVAWAGGAILAAALVALAVSNVLIGKERDLANAERRRAESNLALARQAESEAKENLDFARDAVDRMLVRLGEGLLDRPGLEPLRKSILQDALRLSERFGEQAGDDPDVRHEVARARNRMAHILTALNDVPAAEDSRRRAIRILRDLRGENPREDAYELDLAFGLTELAHLLLTKTTRTAEVLEVGREAVGILDGLVDRRPESGECRRHLANGQQLIADALARRGENEKATTAYLESLRILDRLVAEDGRSVSYLRNLAGLLTSLGLHHFTQGELTLAEGRYRRGLEILDRLRALPDAPDVRSDEARLWNNLGNTFGEAGDHDAAAEALRKAIDIKGRQALESPDVPLHGQELADGLLNLGNVLSTRGTPKEAEDAYRRSLTVLDSLDARFGASQYRAARAKVQYGIARCLVGLPARVEDGVAAARKSASLFDDLLLETPTVPVYAAGSARARGMAASLLVAAGRSEDAEGEVEQALRVLRPVSEEHSEVPEYAELLATTLMVRAELHRGASRFAAGERTLREAIRVLEARSGERGGLTGRANAGIARCMLGLVLLMQSKLPEAEKELEEGTRILAPIVEGGEGDAKVVLQLGFGRLQLGTLLLQRGDFERARQVLAQTLGVLAPVLESQPSLHGLRDTLAGVNFYLA
ncbi:MAG: serine/threonine-protein kinase, partial [Planctomycetota bacterium]